MTSEIGIVEVTVGGLAATPVGFPETDSRLVSIIKYPIHKDFKGLSIYRVILTTQMGHCSNTNRVKTSYREKGNPNEITKPGKLTAQKR